jgi:sulfide dehydrogenase cytochrome subunit
MTRLPLLLASFACSAAFAQQAAAPAAPPAPAFAASNLSAKGVRDMAANCSACHGTAGKAAQGSAVAGLAGRPKDELTQLMAQFKAGQKPATVMHQIAKGYSDGEIAALADHFSRQPR